MPSLLLSQHPAAGPLVLQLRTWLRLLLLPTSCCCCCRLPLQPPDHPCWVACDHSEGLHVPCHHTACPHHCTLPNGHPWTNNSSPTHPHVIPYADGPAVLWPCCALPHGTVQGVCGCIDLDVGAKQHTAADGYPGRGEEEGRGEREG